MAKPDKDKLPKSLRAVLDMLKAGTTLCRQTTGASGGKASAFEWFLYPGGKSVNSEAAAGLVRLGFVVPVGDAFFEGDSQTFRRSDLPNWRMGGGVTKIFVRSLDGFAATGYM